MEGRESTEMHMRARQGPRPPIRLTHQIDQRMVFEHDSIPFPLRLRLNGEGGGHSYLLTSLAVCLYTTSREKISKAVITNQFEAAANTAGALKKMFSCCPWE